MKPRGNAYFLIIIMAVVLTMIIIAAQMPYYTSKLLPLLIGGIVFVLAAIGLAREFMTRGKPEAAAEGEAGKEEKAKAGLRAYLPISAWILGTSLAIYLVGFVIVIPVFILTYMKSHGVRWTTSIISAILTTAIIYGAFEVALRMVLYRGLIPRLLGFY